LELGKITFAGHFPYPAFVELYLVVLVVVFYFFFTWFSLLKIMA